MEDHEIMALLLARDENAIRMMEQAYGSLCMAQAMRILNNQSDAEECVSDAYLAVWNSIPPQNPITLQAYLLRIVRNLSVTRYHFNSAEKRNSLYDVALDELSEVLPAEAETDEENDALTRAIEAFLDGLSKEDRILFVRRYWYSQSVGDLANESGRDAHYVSVRLHRLRMRLKKFLSKRGIFV